MARQKTTLKSIPKITFSGKSPLFSAIHSIEIRTIEFHYFDRDWNNDGYVDIGYTFTLKVLIRHDDKNYDRIYYDIWLSKLTITVDKVLKSYNRYRAKTIEYNFDNRFITVNNESHIYMFNGEKIVPLMFNLLRQITNFMCERPIKLSIGKFKGEEWIE